MSLISKPTVVRDDDQWAMLIEIRRPNPISPGLLENWYEQHRFYSWEAAIKAALALRWRRDD